MAEPRGDPLADRYADRARAMTVSEVRALFAVAARPDVISLAGGMPFVQALPGDEVLRVVADVVGSNAAVALQYGPGTGHAGLRERLSELMAEDGIQADPEETVITVGAQQALDLLGKLFIEPGDLVAVEAPSYVGALSAFSVYQPRYLQITMDDDGLIVEELEEALAGGTRPKFLYVCPNFHNPAGVTLSLERRRRLVEVCRIAEIPIVEDNPYGMLRFEGEPLPALRTLDPENVIYLGTLSKIFCPGIRVGWVLAAPPVVDRLIRFKEAADLCSSNLNMLVAEAWLSEPERWKGSLTGLIDVYRSRRDAALSALERHFPPGSTWTHPSGGFFVWVEVPGMDSRAMLPSAVEHKVAYVPGTAFYPDGRGADRVRLAYCYPPEDAIEEGIRRLGELVAAPVAGAARSVTRS
ncbi:MAG TPA: PLP-dependent aminotransferase family protein [Actinomycetota bacterium]|nr:PLP-dependent aminotransferase family protein [Actinomycetota bacterium]